MKRKIYLIVSALGIIAVIFISFKPILASIINILLIGFGFFIYKSIKKATQYPDE